VLALLLTALGAVAWRGWTAARVPPGDPQLVVVAPWRVASTDTSLAYLVEGFPDLVAGKLDVPGRIRTTDMRTVLAAWRRAGRDPAAVGEREAASEALHL